MNTVAWHGRWRASVGLGPVFPGRGGALPGAYARELRAGAAQAEQPLWPMQMLRCSSDTNLLPSDGHH
jgi:hypothetical protein